MQVIAFRTTDAEALRRYLAAHNVTVPQAVEQQADGSAEFTVADAEAHRIVFIEPHGTTDQQGAVSHRLIHVGFMVKDRGAMEPLYKDILGFRAYWHRRIPPERDE